MQPTYPPPQQPPMGYYPPPKKSSNTVLFVIVGVIGGLFVLGVLAAVAIPSFLKMQKKAKKSQADMQLHFLERALKSQFAELAGFPTESAGLTPSVPCCDSGRPDKKCEPSYDDWAGPPWSTIGFEVDEPGYFQFSYQGEPSGQSFVATAVGDLDCDGTTVTYTLRGQVTADQMPEFTVIPPSNAD